jgi:outer membrane immunogenic protein
MKKITLLAGYASIAALAGAAAQAQPAPAMNWSGVYVGANLGYNWAGSGSGNGYTTVNQLSGVDAGDGPVTVPSTSFGSNIVTNNGSGVIGGGQVGFNAQSGAFVFGIEGDFDGLSATNRQYGSYSLPATGLTTGATVNTYAQFSPQWEATIRGRLGFAMDRFLVYGTGGVAFVHFNESGTTTYAPSVTDAVVAANPGVTYGPYVNGGGYSPTRTGWTVGGGVEYAMSRNVSVGAEYRYTDVGSYDIAYGSPGPNGALQVSRPNFTDNAILAKVNFRFTTLPHM